MSKKLVVADFECDERMGGGGDESWNLDWGSEFIFKYIAPRLGPNSKVLDVCCGYGRASAVLGFKGCNITFFDKSEENIETSLQQADLYSTINQGIVGDVEQLDTLLIRPDYDAIIILEGMVHLHKTTANRLIASAARLLKTGGYLYVDAPSTLDDHYTDFQKWGNEMVDTDTFLDLCSCSGYPQYEPFCFFHPGELALNLSHHGLRVEFQDSAYYDYRTYKTIAIGRKQ